MEPTRRLRSLDALRGFDMLWIIGLDAFFRGLAAATDVPFLDAWAHQLEHVPWDGLRAYDLIFPLFMFLSGVAIPWSVGAKQDGGKSRLKLALGILRRVVLLVVLGMVYNGLLDLRFETLRVASVLGQIGMAYGFAALTWLFVRHNGGRIAVMTGLFVLVAVLQLLVPVPGHGAGVLTEEGIINGWIDRHLLPGRLYGGSFDPEGILCFVSAAVLPLAGAFAGERLRKAPAPRLANVLLLAGCGGVAIMAGWLSQTLGYPPIKAGWTGTFNLYAGGISLVLLAVFHLAIDFVRFNWSLPLQIVGMNPLTIYLLARIVPFAAIATFFAGGIARLSGDFGPVILAATTLLIEWLVLWVLWKKKIFLRV
ncbi:acyltransferase [Haloferula helveola]|uniref:Acyltransferase n=1 Tax=Haloferula helveola TaxID=490095 RepID=A0ABN6H8Z0_9BACT|nr:acyltransferase [Haloferula helveola]